MLFFFIEDTAPSRISGLLAVLTRTCSMWRHDHRTVSQLLAEKSCGSTTSGRHFLLFTWSQFGKKPLTSLRSSNFSWITDAPQSLSASLMIWIHYFSGKPYSSYMSESPESTLNTGRTIKTSFILIRQRVTFLITKWKTHLQKRNTSRKYRWQTWHLEYFCFPPFIDVCQL